MKVLVVSEGKHELRPNAPSGALLLLVERLLDCDVELICKRVSDPDVKTHRPSGKGEGMWKRAISWMRYAERHAFDAVVLVVDNDEADDRSAPLEEAQADLRMAIPRAIGLAIESFDAWMLADETAWHKVLGIVIGRQPDPERIRKPKGECDRICNSRMGISDLYASLAEVVNLDLLCDRCPKGFAPFARRVRELRRN